MLGALIFLLAIMGVFVLWLFFSLQPKFVNARQLSVFNWTVVAMCVMICAGVVTYIYTELSPEGRDEYFGPVALAATLAIETVFFTVALLLRNFWIFRAPSANRSSLFD